MTARTSGSAGSTSRSGTDTCPSRFSSRGRSGAAEHEGGRTLDRSASAEATAAERLRHPSWVPLFMDRHEFEKITAADIAAAHLKDLEVQGRYGVHFLNYWFDEVRQHAFCLASGPDIDAVQAAHRESHGMVPAQVIGVDEALVARFMGGIVNHQPGIPYVETAFRTILFTDIEGS